MIRIAFSPFFTCRPIDFQRSYPVTSVASGRCIEIRMVLFRLYVWNFAMVFKYCVYFSEENISFMQDNAEYQANLFAADLLLADADIADMAHNEDLD